jgi:hypothetical protein
MKYQIKLKNHINLFASFTKPAKIEEIRFVERTLSISIPVSLKEFFLLVGNDYDYLWGGGGADKLNLIPTNHEICKKILKECSVVFNREYFVFSRYGDDQFMFVYLDDGDDPSVYRFETELFYCGDDYVSGSSSWGFPRGVIKISDSFSAAINKLVEDELNNKKTI